MFNPRSSKNITSFLNLLRTVPNNPFSDNPSLFFPVRFISKPPSDQSIHLTVSYLKNKLGFSPESALKLSKYVNFKTPENPDSVLTFFDQHGFSKAQIRQMIKTRPNLLCSSVQKSLLPKIQFFQSKGIPDPEISRLFFYNPRLFARSLKKHVIPCFDRLSGLLRSESKAVVAIRRNPYLMVCDLDAYMVPNIKTLIDNGVPESNIVSMFNNHPGAFVMIPDRFKDVVKEVKELGFDPLLFKFVHAVIVFRKVSKPAMESKLDVFKKWGLSEEEIWEAFRKYPGVLEASKEKIAAIMDFLVNEMGFRTSIITFEPTIFARSLEKRIAPRGLFALDLLSRGLIKDLSLRTIFATSEKAFIQKFMNQYKDKAPELLKLYEEKLESAVRGKYKIEPVRDRHKFELR
ncbi:hypothetical protein GQ457_13G026670 [Hibiscus cannabinus]